MTLEIKEKRARAEDLFIDGKIGKDRLGDILSRLDEEEARISKEMEKELTIIRSVALKEDAKRSWKEFLEEERELAEAFFDHASYEDLKDLVNIVLDRVILSADKPEKLVRFVFRLPVTPTFAARYAEDEEIEWTDDQGKSHVVAVVPDVRKRIPLDPTKAPPSYRTVEFLPNDGGNGGGGRDKNETNDPENPHCKAEKRLIQLLREKYRQIYESHHESLKIPFRKEGDFYDSVGFSMPGLERRTDAKHSSEPTIWFATSASEAAFGGEEEPWANPSNL